MNKNKATNTDPSKSTRTDRAHGKMAVKPGEKGAMRPVPVAQQYPMLANAQDVTTASTPNNQVAPGGTD